jgi:hypothetical protein
MGDTMKISALENNMLKIAMEISRGRSGVPVPLADLRKRFVMSHKEFDQAVQAMGENGYFLTKNARPTGSLSDAEKKAMVPDGAGNYYFAINPSDDIEIPKKTSKGKPGRGGSRTGAGRPAVKAKIKRVPLAGARIPGWLMDWLRDQGNMGGRIEAALIEKYNLMPPDK